ncbi:hypothetical protein [Helicobacter sp. T3_23-1056]
MLLSPLQTNVFPSLRAKMSVSDFLLGNLFCLYCIVDCHALDFAKTQNLIARNDKLAGVVRSQ